jgi:hypothetical protein
MVIWYSFWSFGIAYGHLVQFVVVLVYVVVILYIFHQFGMLNQEKSGNPISDLNMYVS